MAHAAVAGRTADQQECFSETKPLLKLLMKLNKIARPIFDESGTVAIDMARMPWEGEGAQLLGEIGELVARTARTARKRWNPSQKRWEQIV